MVGQYSHNENGPRLLARAALLGHDNIRTVSFRLVEDFWDENFERYYTFGFFLHFIILMKVLELIGVFRVGLAKQDW